MKKTLFTTLLIFMSMLALWAEPFGQITVKNCYQFFTTSINGGSYNVLGGSTAFGTTNDHDFSSVDVYELIGGDSVYTGTIPCGTSIWLDAGTQYVIMPALNPGSFYMGEAVHLTIVDPVVVMSDYNNDGCLAFGESYQFSLSPFLEGFCGYPEYSYTGPTGIVHNNGWMIEDDGYCDPPPGGTFAGGTRCYNMTIHATIYPCNFDPECPMLYLQNTVTVCCNNCRPYTNPDVTKSLEGKEPILNIYPNPSSDKIQVQSAYTGVVEIYNTIGQLVRTLSVEAGSETVVDISSLSQGNYIYRFTVPGQESITGKLWVTHP